ncbi:hypothetical protein B9Z55_023923 [Caenorhabditis nigoni]|uniref:Uncharacterized protein n=2 Tax=Caenorhabditis nigoni TaxID=1611254 RepID=A0A2G5SSA6_9PELO|nr:hypothetical protein B9Z55_023921 [Caenorhabditis nigoni]PIC17819.1 hypothetical protein B9Z55_023923 [Caenorhabditis nigoni]
MSAMKTAQEAAVVNETVAVERAAHVTVDPRHEIQAVTEAEVANEATQVVSVNAPVSFMESLAPIASIAHVAPIGPILPSIGLEVGQDLAGAITSLPVNAQLAGGLRGVVARSNRRMMWIRQSVHRREALSRAMFQRAMADERRLLAFAREWFGDCQDVVQLVQDSTAALEEAEAIEADDRAHHEGNENNEMAQCERRERCIRESTREDLERAMLEHAKAEEQRTLAMVREWFGDCQDVLQLVQDSIVALEEAEAIEADDRAHRDGNGNNDVARFNPCERCIEALENAILEHEYADDEGAQQAQ